MLFTVILQFNILPWALPYPAHMVLILFVQVLKKVLKSLKFDLKNPAATLFQPFRDSCLQSPTVSPPLEIINKTFIIPFNIFTTFLYLQLNWGVFKDLREPCILRTGQSGDAFW